MLPLLLIALACAPVEPAPADLDGLVHYLWRASQELDEDAVGEGLGRLHEVLDGDTLDEVVDGLVSGMSAEEVALAEPGYPVDPSAAVGLFVAGPLACELERAEAIVLSPHQDLLYDGYQAYTRDFTGDVDAYLAREVPTVGWEHEFTVKVPLTGTYTVSRRAGAWWSDARRYPYGPVLVHWDVLTGPAEFEGDPEDHVFDQDFRVEVFYEPEPGRLVHLKAMWRNMEAGVSDIHSESVQRIFLNNLAAWEARTGEWCAVEELPTE